MTTRTELDTSPATSPTTKRWRSLVADSIPVVALFLGVTLGYMTIHIWDLIWPISPSSRYLWDVVNLGCRVGVACLVSYAVIHFADRLPVRFRQEAMAVGSGLRSLPAPEPSQPQAATNGPPSKKTPSTTIGTTPELRAWLQSQVSGRGWSLSRVNDVLATAKIALQVTLLAISAAALAYLSIQVADAVEAVAQTARVLANEELTSSGDGSADRTPSEHASGLEADAVLPDNVQSCINDGERGPSPLLKQVICYQKEYQGRLDRAGHRYLQLLVLLPIESHPGLVAAQSAWLASHERDCRTLHPQREPADAIQLIQCKSRSALKRLAQLEEPRQ